MHSLSYYVHAGNRAFLSILPYLHGFTQKNLAAVDHRVPHLPSKTILWPTPLRESSPVVAADSFGRGHPNALPVCHLRSEPCPVRAWSLSCRWEQYPETRGCGSRER